MSPKPQRRPRFGGDRGDRREIGLPGRRQFVSRQGIHGVDLCHQPPRRPLGVAVGQSRGNVKQGGLSVHHAGVEGGKRFRRQRKRREINAFGGGNKPHKQSLLGGRGRCVGRRNFSAAWEGVVLAACRQEGA